MRIQAGLVLIAAIVFAAVPFLMPEFGGFDPELYPNPQRDAPVQPAGYAFSIWGVIYAWLIASAVYGLIWRADDAAWAPMRPPLAASMLIGAAWLPVAMISPIWATVMIFAMLGLAAAALRLAPRGNRWWAVAPVALYAGWLSAASFAALGLLGAGYGVVLDQSGWAMLAIVLALATAVAIHLLRREEWVYLVSVIWALIAITVSNWGVTWVVAALSLAGALVLAARMAMVIRANSQSDA